MDDFPFPVVVEGDWGSSYPKVKTKLQKYFQSRKKSNGSDCTVECDEGAGRFIVRFKSDQIRTNVLKKEDHEIEVENKKVKLGVYFPAQVKEEEPPQSEGETSKLSGSQADGDHQEGTEKTPQVPHVVLENVQETISRDVLVLMVENISDLREADFDLEMIHEKKITVVSFRNTNDAVRFLLNSGKNSRFQQFGLTAKPLEPTKSVRVENLTPQVSKEMLELYFERKKEGGGDVEAIKMIPEEHAAIVTFLDCKVTETIQQRKHYIYKAPINIYPFYESIGAALYGKDRPRWKLPDPFTERIDPTVWNFLIKKNEITTINDQMSNHFCQVNLGTAEANLTPLPALLKPKGLSAEQINNWRTNAKDAFQKIIAQYKTTECAINTSVWNVAEKEIHLAVKQDVIVLPDLTKGIMTVSGLAQDVDKLKPVVERIVQKVTSQIERELNSITENIFVPPAILYILEQDGLQQEVKTYPKLNFAYKADAMTMTLSGLAGEVFAIKSWIYERQLKMKQEQLGVEPEILGFLRAVNSDELSSDLLASRGISAVYRIENDSVMLTGNSDKALYDAQKQLRDALTFQNLDIKDMTVMTRPEWQILNNKLRDTYNSVKKNRVFILFTAQNRIMVSGFHNDVKQVCESLSDFINKYSHVREAVRVQSPAVIKYIQERKIQTWKNFLKSKDVEVYFELKRAQIQLNGAQYIVQDVKPFFQKMAESLHVDQLKIVKPGAKKYFLERQNLLFPIMDTNCLVMLQEENAEEEIEDQESSLSTYCKVQMPNGLIVTVAKADICKFHADVVVNASNEELQHVGGLAKALLNAAGPELQDACNRYRSKNRNLNVGDAIITEAGRLPCRYVVHAVGPRFSDWDSATAVRLLRRAVRQALHLTINYGCRSVAIPAISSGIFGFPLELCAENIAAVVRECCEDHIAGKSPLSEIHLVNHDEKTTQAMTKAVKTIFADQQLQIISPTSKPVSLEPTSTKKSAPETNAQLPRKVQMAEVLERMHTGEGLRIRLRTGSIEDATTAVIVNTISDDLDLGKGAVSKAILTAAGPKIQSAIRDNVRKTSVECGSVVVTDGYGLKCEKVFHAVCPFWDNGTGKSEQMLITIIKKCLKEAEKHEVENISFPAIGTGNLGFPKDLVAKLMLSEVQTYSRQHTPRHLSDVDIILHPSDSQTIHCFRRQFGDQKQVHKGQYTTSPIDQPQQGSGFFGQISTPSLGVHTIRVGSLTLEVSSGDITKQNTDAIVNSSNETFTLKAGVSKAILTEAGSAVERECAQQGSQSYKDYIITQPGQLSCKNIIHVAGKTEPSKIKEAVYKVLQVCEEKGFTSVSFPAMGTGAGGVNPSMVAEAMISAVVDFEKKRKGQLLKCVKILIFQTGMVADFHKSLKMREGTEQPEEKSVISRIKESLSSFFGVAGVSPNIREEFTIVGEEFAPAIFNFCGESFAEVSRAKSCVQDLIMKEQTEKTIEDSSIGLFTQEDCANLLSLQKKFTVSICLEKKGSDSLIHIEGLTRDVLTVNDEIKEMIHKVESLERYRREAMLVSAMVEWKYEDGGTFHPFDVFTSFTLEQAFDRHCSHVKIKIGNLEYMADLTCKEATHGGKTIKLKRTELKDAQEDLPSTWDDMKHADHLEVTLIASSSEYQQVEKEFRKTGLTNKIIKIDRIQNSTLWKSYQIKKTCMNKKNKHSNNEMQLFHGTCSTTVSHINEHGFNRSYAGRNAAMIGNGTYFAVDPSYSANDTYSKPNSQKQKNMYLARVLVGDYTQGRSGLIVPPAKASQNPSDLYDSVVDNISNPQMFVTFNDIQAYPEYLITFF